MKYIYILYLLYNLFFIGFVSEEICAQSTSQIHIYGYVLDSNNIPMPNVNVMDIKSKKGAFTDENGYFSFNTNKTTTRIIFSHIGYQSFSYDFNINDEDSLNLVVYLSQKYSTLAPVEINSNNTNVVYSKPDYYIYDFEFYKQNILLLINHKRNSNLLYLDEDNDTLSILKTNKGVGLLRDCLGNIQVISKDSIYQIYIDEDDFIYSVYSFPFDNYKSQLAPCIASVDSTLLFARHSKNKQSEIFYYYDSKHKPQIFKQITDARTNNNAIDEYIRIIKTEEDLKLEQNRFGSSGKMAEGKSSLEKGRALFQRKAYYKFILTRPIYNPIFSIKDSIFLFDHVNNRCFVYDKTLTLIRNFKINYCKQLNWAHKLFIDKVNHRVYAKFEKNGQISLKEISINTGEIMKEYKIEGCIFPLKIGVNNGNAYFLKSELYGSYKTKLYKQRLN